MQLLKCLKGISKSVEESLRCQKKSCIILDIIIGYYWILLKFFFWTSLPRTPNTPPPSPPVFQTVKNSEDFEVLQIIAPARLHCQSERNCLNVNSGTETGQPLCKFFVRRWMEGFLIIVSGNFLSFFLSLFSQVIASHWTLHL